MRAGKLRHRVAIQAATETRNERGGIDETWTTEQTRWASVEPLIGREYMDGKQVNADVSHKVRFRWFSGLTPSKRLLFGTRVFGIDSVLNPDERNKELVVMCKEKI